MSDSAQLKSQKGTTLLETILLLGVCAMIILLGLRFYSSYQTTLRLQQIRYNVDQLFQAMGGYYMANCASGAFSPSAMTYPPSSTAYFPLSIATSSSSLATSGYLSNWQAYNPLVDPSGGESGYVIQLNPVISTPVSVNACVVLNPGTACVPISTNTNFSGAAIPLPSMQAKLVSWTLQVAVKINNPTQTIQSYAAIAGADCISGQSASSSPTTVDPCPSSNTGQNYLVWQRSISNASVNSSGALSPAQPLLQQFNIQYTHDQNYELNSGYSTPVYYLCGG